MSRDRRSAARLALLAVQLADPPIHLSCGSTEETPVSRLYISALTIGLSYFMGGLCPLVPYFFVDNVNHGLMLSSAVTLIILLIFGVAKTHFTGATGGVGGYLYGAVSTMMVGGLAGASSFVSLPPLTPSCLG